MQLVINAATEVFPESAQEVSALNNYHLNILSALYPGEKNLPLADLLCHYHGLKGEWIVVSPLHWHATHNDVIVDGIYDSLMLDELKAQALFSRLQEWMQIEGMPMVYHDCYHWLLQIDNKPPIKSVALPYLLQLPLTPILRAMDSSQYWQRLFTELQMWMHQNMPDSMVNGVWFYGEGKLDWRQSPIFSDDPDLLQHFPNQVNTLQSQTIAAENALWILQTNPPDLNKRCQPVATTWFWNNKTYQLPAKPWWKFWR